MNAPKEHLYSQALRDLEAVFTPGHYELDAIGKMATIASVLHQSFPEWPFVGFYRVIPPAKLVIGPYQGPVLACGSIDFGKGVCGMAATTRLPVIVPDVTQFPCYIACDAQTRSEIVIPVLESGALRAVLDVDSAEINTFDDEDADWLRRIAGLVY